MTKALLVAGAVIIFLSMYLGFVFFANRELTELNNRREESIKSLLAEKLEAEKPVFIISHFPVAGSPWTVEKYWKQEELWISLRSYGSRAAAEDVKSQLESGTLKTRDLFR